MMPDMKAVKVIFTTSHDIDEITGKSIPKKRLNVRTIFFSSGQLIDEDFRGLTAQEAQLLMWGPYNLNGLSRADLNDHLANLNIEEYVISAESSFFRDQDAHNKVSVAKLGRNPFLIHNIKSIV